MIFLTLIIFILIIGILVLVHEFGHYITALKVGIRVEEFAIGMGPKIFSTSRIPKGVAQDTPILYTIRAFPIGGFVQMYGEGNYDNTEPNSFGGKAPSKRLLVLVAGVFMNMVLAAALFYMQGIRQDFKYRNLQIFENKYQPWFGEVSQQKVVIGAAVPGSQLEGKVSPMEIIDKINGQDYTADKFRDLIQQNKDKEMDFTLVNYASNKSRNLKVKPEYNEEGKTYTIGIYPRPISFIEYKGAKKLIAGPAQAMNNVQNFIFSIKQLINISKEQNSIAPIAENMGGPIGIFDIIKLMIISFGFWGLVELTALFSVNLAVFNILPIPALDGGHVLFTLIELITKRRLHNKIYNYLTLAGFIFLMGFMLIITGVDLVKLTFVRDFICPNGKDTGVICQIGDFRSK